MQGVRYSPKNGATGAVPVCTIVHLSTPDLIAKPCQILPPQKLEQEAPWLEFKKIPPECPNGIEFAEDHFEFKIPPTPKKIYLGNLSPEQQAVCAGCLAIRFPSGVRDLLCIKALADNPVETNLLQANTAINRTNWKRINENIPDGCPNGYIPTPASEDQKVG